MNLANKTLHSLGVSFVQKYLGFKKSAKMLFSPTNRPAALHVQNMMGGTHFTIDIGSNPNLVQSLNKNVQLFLDYGTPNLLKVYECTNPSDYEVAEVGGVNREGARDSSFKRIVLKFDAAKMKLLDVMEDPALWKEFASLSQAKAFNLASANYGR